MPADEVSDDETAADAGETVPLGTEAIAEEAAKRCCVCGLDVSQKKRMRDRGGRYWCAFCQDFDAVPDKSVGVVPCPDCGRATRQTMMVEQGAEIGGKPAAKGAERVCRSCNQNFIDERKYRSAHKAAVTADPEVAIRKLIRQIVMGLLGLAILAVLVALYHYGLLYVRPKAWVPFLSACISSPSQRWGWVLRSYSNMSEWVGASVCARRNMTR